MSKKIIDKMIEELLQERASFDYEVEVPTDLPHYSVNNNNARIAINTLKDATTPDEVLNNKDLQHLINNPEEINYEHVEASRFLITSFKKGLKDGRFRSSSEVLKATQAIEALRQIESKWDEQVQAAQEPQSTMTAPEFSTRRGESSKAVAPFPPEQLAIIQRAMGSSSSIYSRIKKISSISKEFFQAATKGSNASLRKKPTSEILNNIMLLDILNYIVKDTDAGAAAYLFEYFLALLFEGKVTGKETTDAGKMGAVDFVAGDGTLGSAKYYSSPSNIEQATGGFTDKPVKYVIAIKKEDTSETGKYETSKGGKADPARIVALDIYYFSVQKKGKNFYSKNYKLKKKMDKGSEKISLSPLISPESHAGTIFLASVATSNFISMIDDAVSNTEQAVKEAYQAMKEMFSELQSVKESTKLYISTGNAEKGNQAYGSLKKTEDSFTKITTTLSSPEDYGDSAKIQEIKSQDIDNLIAEAIRDIKKNSK